MGIFASFAKNGEIRPSVSYKIIREQNEERKKFDSSKEQLVIWSSAFLKMRELKRH